MLIFIAIAWLTSSPKYDACVEECEVLDMDFVRHQGCKCTCFDPVERELVELPNPECVDRS
jgi:hypothetical protein